METKILTTEELFGKKKKEKEQLGSGFGGGWNLTGLIKEQEEKQGIKTTEELFGKEDDFEEKFQKAYKQMATKQGLSLDPDDTEHYYDYRALYEETGKLEPDETGHFPSKYKLEGHPRMVVEGIDTKTGESVSGVPKLEDIKIQENNLKAMSKTYSQLESSIDTDYKQYIDLGNQLDELEAAIQEAPPELQFMLNQKHNKLVTEHNTLVDKIKSNTRKYENMYSQLNEEGRRYNENINKYNQLAETQTKATEQKDLWAQLSDIKVIDIPKAIPQFFKGIWHGIVSLPQSVGGLMRQWGESEQIRSGVKEFPADPRWQGLDEKIYKAMYENKLFKKQLGKAGEFASKKGQEIIKKNIEEVKKILPPEEATEAEKLFFDVGSGFASLGLAIGSSVATGSHAVPALLFGAHAMGHTYQEAREAEVNPLKASALGAWNFATEAGMEYIGVEFILTKLPFSKGISVALKAANEGMQEYLQEAGSNLVAKYGWDKMRKWNEGSERAALIGFIVGGSTSVVIDTISRETGAPKEAVKPIVENYYKELKKFESDLDKDQVIEEIKKAMAEGEKKEEAPKPGIMAEQDYAPSNIKISEVSLREMRELMLHAGQSEEVANQVANGVRFKVGQKQFILINKDAPQSEKEEIKLHELRHAGLEERVKQGHKGLEKAEDIVKYILQKPDADPTLYKVVKTFEDVGYTNEELAKELIAEGILSMDEAESDLLALQQGKGGVGEKGLRNRKNMFDKTTVKPEVKPEPPKVEPKLPDILVPQKEAITKKIDEVIERELPKVKVKFPDITAPEIREQIIPKVEEEINKIIPKADAKAPDIDIPEKEILAKVEQVVKEELPKLKYEAKAYEGKVPDKPISEGEKGDIRAIEKEIIDSFKPLEKDDFQVSNSDQINYIRSKYGKTQLINAFQKLEDEGKIKIDDLGRIWKTTPATEQSSEAPEALYAKNWQVEMGKEPETDKRINKTQIVNWAESSFGFPIKGKVTHKWKAAGTFYPRQQIVRMGKWGELSVMVHEISHGVDDQLEKSLGEDWKRPNRVITSELADLDYDPKKRRTSEGFAEFMRYKMTTNKAEELAPNFNKYFDDILAKMPDLKKKFDSLKEKMDTWNKQGAENRIIQHIDWKGEHTERGLSSKAKKSLEWVNVRFNDEFYYPRKITKEIEKALGKELPPTKNPALMMEYSKSKAGSVARTFVMEKAVDEYGNVVGDGLIDVLKPIPNKEMKQFISYAVAKRAMYLEARKIESGFDIEDAKYIIEKYKDKGWDSTVKELTKWSNHMLDWLVNAGALDKKSTEIMRALNPVYLPFKRAFFEDVNVTKGVGGYVDTGKGIKSIKGSGRPIINPLESMISQTTEMIAKAQKIRIAKVFIELAEEKGLGGFITKVPAPMKATTFNANQIKSYLDEIASGEEGMMSSNNYDELLTVFTQDFKYNGKDNIVSMWRNGKQEFYEIHPDLYEAFNGIDPLKLGPIGKVFAPFARMLRLGATGLKFSFGFARNPFRDALSYAVFSKRKNATVFDPIKGYYKDIVCKPGELTWRFKAMGGGLSGQIGFDRASVQNTYDEMLDKKLGKIGKVLQVVKHPVNTLADIISITEMGPRSAEIEASYKKYTSEKWLKDHPNWTEEDAYVQAFLDAQDVTVNFTKSGKWAKQLNQVVAFFNVAIRGPEKLYRSFRERPIQTMVKGIAWLALPAILSWHRNKDKDWYKNLPPAYKYNNMWFEIGENVYRLPIPFELGMVFMSAPQAFLDTYQGKDDQAIKGLMELGKAQIPIPMPSALAPVYEVAKNKNWLGNPIESPGMQYLYPTERKRDYTSKLAVSLSKGADEIGIKLSPIQIDYLIDGYSGGFLKQFRISGEQLADYPVIGDLVLRNPGYPNKQLNNFFSDYELLGQKRSSGVASREELRKYSLIKGFYSYYKTMQDRIKRAEENKNNKLLKTYYKQMTDRLARYGYK